MTDAQRNQIERGREMNKPDEIAAAEPPLDCRVRQRTKRYLNNGHEWDDDGCCVHCGFDGAEYWWWRRDTYEGRAMATEMPKCKVPNVLLNGAPSGASG